MNTYKMTLEDSVDSMTFDLLEVPIVDKDVEGAVDNTTLDGNIFTDYLWLKKNYVQKWSIMCDDEYSRLRGFYTRQFDNASVPTYKLFYGENISEDRAISGDYILVDNTTERNAPITSFELLGDAEQDGTPTPDAPQAVNTVTGEQTVKIEGKNLFDGTYINYAIGGTGGNMWFPSSATRSAIISCQPSTTYTVKKYGGNRLNIADAPTMPSDNSTVNVLYSSNSAMEHTITTSATARYLLVYVSNDSTEPEMQVEVGSTATAYEPYQGQSYEINLGKNLLDIDNIAVTNAYISNTGVETSSATNLLTDYIPAFPSTAYTLSTNTTMYNLAFAEFDANKTFISRTSISATKANTITTNASTRYIRVSFNRNNSVTITRDYVKSVEPQLELGSTATAYSAYFTPIELAKIGNYQDRIYKDEDKWYIEKQVGKVVLDGTENWADYTTQLSGYYMAYETTKGKWGNAGNFASSDRFLNDHFTSQGNGWTSYNGSCLASSGYAVYVKINSSVASDSASLTTWLASNPTTVYYALATPTTTEITNSELVGQLEAILQAYLYTGTNNVSNNAVSPNLAGQMNIGYRLIFSEETVLIEPTAVRLTLTDGGIINVCGCRQNVQLTMRETIQ